jgi:hypothetical protein
MKFLMVLAALVVFAISVMDEVYLRHASNERHVIALSVEDAKWRELVVDSQDIVHDSVIESLSKDAVVTIFNYHPGRAREHISSEKIKDLFLTDSHYEKFRSQFLTWSDHEFRVNNISIKETISPRGQLYRVGVAGGAGVQIWKYTGYMPMLDRGVGQTDVATMKFEVHLVYLGPKGGVGIYGIRLTR